MLTLKEVTEKWGLSENKILQLIKDGYINDVIVENHTLLLPDIPKPLSIKKNINLDDDKRYHYILRACNENLYIDEYILKVNIEYFETLMTQLILDGYLTGKFNGKDNLNCVITPKGIKSAKSRKKICINSIVNINNNIGLVNI